jgi:hypothetical protein
MQDRAIIVSLPVSAHLYAIQWQKKENGGGKVHGKSNAQIELTLLSKVKKQRRV